MKIKAYSLVVGFSLLLLIAITLSLSTDTSAQPATPDPTRDPRLDQIRIRPAETLAVVPAPVKPRTPLPPFITGDEGKRLIVDLSDFRIYAYEDGEVVRSTLINTGRYGAATLIGTFEIEAKYEERDMVWRGNTVEDVPYILYYDDEFAIHGAYWHDEYGVRASSGCVNLPGDEAEWYYEWAEIGTVVVIQY